jgi:hypothetical protein
MADFSTQKHIGDIIDVKALSSSLSWTAGGASDSATWTGISVDRMNFSTSYMPHTADFDVFYDATLASGAHLSLSFDVQSAPDGSTWSDYATEASQIVATGPSGGGRVVGIARMTVSSADDPSIASATNLPGQTATPSLNLSSAQRFVRFNFAPHLSSAGTDTAIAAAVGVFAGFDGLQAPSN